MLVQRIVSAIFIILPLIGGLIFAPAPWAGLLSLVLFLVAAWEWTRFVPNVPEQRRWQIFALYALVMGALAVLATWASELFYAVAGVCIAGGALWWLVACVNVLRYPFKPSTGFVVLSGLFVLVPALAVLLHNDLLTIAPRSHLLIFVFVLVWAADIGAYFSGRALGRHKLAPSVSPGKTWEGLVGGLLLAGLFAAVVATKVSLWLIAPIAVIVVLASVIGDLTVSLFKRSAGVKDSGQLFPGHGGVLDRFDSFAAAAPVFVALMWLGRDFWPS